MNVVNKAYQLFFLTDIFGAAFAEKVITHGVGTGVLPRPNERISEFIWDGVDGDLFERVESLE